MGMLTWPGADGADQIVDDGGDATLLIHKGKEFEEKYAKDKSLPDPESTSNPEFKCILNLSRIPFHWMRQSGHAWPKIAVACQKKPQPGCTVSGRWLPRANF